ncbi:hypothetical protein [Clostridium sp. BJN0001]|uniref:hypothetical protein n=1 Tax=Clostridium sp. BJN0001 TaxID=2930219 RepID=UPI001FD015ED|nr:hypothetical protein [Clostridium sp. BJN0001]
MNIVFGILSFLFMLVIIFALYYVCRKFIFTKVRINKYIPLAIAIVLFVIQLFSGKIGIINNYVNIALSVVSVLFFLWFMDIMQTGGPKQKEKKIVIKSKPKPNRVKNKKNNK